MKKNEFLKMMFQDNETESEPQKTVYADIIECMDIALSQMPDTFEVSNEKNAKEAYELVKKYARDNKRECVALFESCEKVIAPYLGAKYERLAKRFAAPKVDVNLDDFI